MDKAEYHEAIAAAGLPRILFYLLQFTWGLPVNLAGLLVFLCCRGHSRSETFRNGIVTYLPGDRGGLSLGIFIFLSVSDENERHSLRIHEYGHTIQCLFLGPLYWIAVVLPSAVWFHFFADYRKKHRVPYDAFYCEGWATALGKRWSGV